MPERTTSETPSELKATMAASSSAQYEGAQKPWHRESKSPCAAPVRVTGSARVLEVETPVRGHLRPSDIRMPAVVDHDSGLGQSP